MAETPILDLIQDPPKPTANRLALALGMLGGGLVGWISNSHGIPAINVPLFFLASYIAIAIHELGHLAAGVMAGMPPGGIVVGGFMFIKSGDRWRYRFNPRMIFSGGLARPLPRKGEFRPSRYAWMVAGGPLASLLLTTVCGVAFLKWDNGPMDWIGSLFWGSAITLASLIPYSAGVNKSDGARLWLLIMRPELSRAWMAVVLLQSQEAEGVLPRDWDADLVEQMLSGSESDRENPWRRLLASIRCEDEGNEDAAAVHLEAALASSAGSGKVVRQCLFLCAAERHARVRCDAAKARLWRERALRLRKPETVDSTDAAIAFCEGRYDDALRHLAAARAYIAKRKLNSDLARFALEKLDEMEKAAAAAAVHLKTTTA